MQELVLYALSTGEQGQVYLKDLGEQGTGLPEAMMEFNPDKTWTPLPSTTK